MVVGLVPVVVLVVVVVVVVVVTSTGPFTTAVVDAVDGAFGSGGLAVCRTTLVTVLEGADILVVTIRRGASGFATGRRVAILRMTGTLVTGALVTGVLILVLSSVPTSVTSSAPALVSSPMAGDVSVTRGVPT